MSILTDDNLELIWNKAIATYTALHPKSLNVYERDHAGYRAIAKAAHRETLKMVKVLILQAIADEPDFPGEMPDELWEEIKDNREVATETLRITVRLTKNGITDRFLEALNQSGEE